MLTAEDVVTLSYDGKGNIKSSIGKLLEPFEKLPVKFVEEPEDEDDDGEVDPDSRENIFLGDKFTFNSDATIGNLGWSIAPNGAIVKDSQIKFGDKGYSLKITASGTSGNFYLMNLAQHTIDIPSGNYELIFMCISLPKAIYRQETSILIFQEAGFEKSYHIHVL